MMITNALQQLCDTQCSKERLKRKQRVFTVSWAAGSNAAAGSLCFSRELVLVSRDRLSQPQLERHLPLQSSLQRQQLSSFLPSRPRQLPPEQIKLEQKRKKTLFNSRAPEIMT